MRRADGDSVAAIAAELGSALLCLAVLVGCQAHGAVSQQPADGAQTSTSSGAVPANGVAATGAASAPSDAGVDSDLNAVYGQLSGLDSALAQAAQSPSDGG